MDAQENKAEGGEEGKNCRPCGKTKCCCKAFGAVALLVVGGLAGFFAGRHCGSGMCPLKSTSAPAATAPATPAATPGK